MQFLTRSRKPPSDPTCFYLFQLVELLLRHGANPLLQNRKGKSPIDVATNKEIIKLMRSEIVASSSSCSSNSLADIRSPTSPESNMSEREDVEHHHKLIDSANGWFICLHSPWYALCLRDRNYSGRIVSCWVSV